MAAWVATLPSDERTLQELLVIANDLSGVHEVTRGLHLAAACQAIAQAQGLVGVSGRAHLQMARDRIEQHEFKEAEDFLSRAEAELKEVGDLEYLCEVEVSRGDAELARERLQQAFPHFQRARELAARGGFTRLEGDALWRMASAYVVWESDDRAREHFLLALPLFEKAGALSEVARVHRNLADIDWIHDRNDDAERGYASALELDRVVNPEGAGHDLMGLGEVHAEAGRMRDAVRSFQEALASYEAVGDLLDQARAHWRLANAFREGEEVDRAVEHLRRSMALSAELGDAHQEGLACAALGTIYLHRGDRGRATELAQRAEALSPGVLQEIADGPSKRYG